MSETNKKPFIRIPITILGKGAVGKSSLTYRYWNKESPDCHDATIEDKYKAFETIGSNNVEVEILDTAGEDDYQNLLDMWIEYAQGFVLVFAINDPPSFEHLKRNYEKITAAKGQTCPIIIVGNKSDLKERTVSVEQAKGFANKNNWNYFETSAKNNVNCRECFMDVVWKIYRLNQKISTKKENNTCCSMF